MQVRPGVYLWEWIIVPGIVLQGGHCQGFSAAARMPKEPCIPNAAARHVVSSAEEPLPGCFEFGFRLDIDDGHFRQFEGGIATPTPQHQLNGFDIGFGCAVAENREHVATLQGSFQFLPFARDEGIGVVVFLPHGIEKPRWLERRAALSALFVSKALHAIDGASSNLNVPVEKEKFWQFCGLAVPQPSSREKGVPIKRRNVVAVSERKDQVVVKSGRLRELERLEVGSDLGFDLGLETWSFTARGDSVVERFEVRGVRKTAGGNGGGEIEQLD